jgi:hypothetical protein
VEDELPPSLTARLDREVAARVQAQLAAHTGAAAAEPANAPYPRRQERSADGRVIGIVSLVTGVPIMGIVEGTSHGSLGGAVVVMAGIVLVNMAHAFGRRRHQ